MILPDTTYTKIFEVMSSEEEKVAFFIQKEEKKFIREILKKKNNYPRIHTAYYTIPSSRNRYFIWLYLPPIVQNEIYYGSSLVLEQENGERRFINLRSYRPVENGVQTATVKEGIEIISGHYFSRYRERFHIDEKVSTEEMMAGYYGRNVGFLANLDMDRMNPNADKYENAVAWQLNDGISYGSLHEETLPNGKIIEIIEQKTFISMEMLYQHQIDSSMSPKEMKIFLTLLSTQFGNSLTTNPLIQGKLKI